jgi:hypothetical protein
MGTLSRMSAASILFSGLLMATAHAQQALPTPWLVPSFVHRPPNDDVVFASLLEAARQSDSDWVDVAAGNFCGGAEKELVLIKNSHSNFSILRGPAPFAIASSDLSSSSSHPWRAVAAGNLDGGVYDEIVAIRKVTSPGVPDLVVAKADGASCEMSTVIASAPIGNPSNSEWVGAAVGNFDGTGRKQIALLKAAHSNFFFVKLTPTGELTVFHESDLDSSPTQPWKVLAAGDIDGDGVDELIVARQANDGHSATVLAYKWNGSGFSLFATSGFGNDGNSDWSGAAVGDFNGDGRNAIVLVKNQHSNFVVLDYPGSATELRILSTSDLDSVKGQDWRGLAATNWLSADASQLIAIRAAHGDYHTSLFVYGDPFYRFARDTALDGTKGAWQIFSPENPVPSPNPKFPIPNDMLIKVLSKTHTNTYNWDLMFRGDYLRLVEFLDATKGLLIDGRQLRVWVSLVGPSGVVTDPDPKKFSCSFPEESPLTAWSEADFFRSGLKVASCKDYLGWASLIGRLAQDYPHLVGIGIDDFLHHLEDFSGDEIAELESRMRSQAPWLNFVPTAYYGDLKDKHRPDLGQTLDTMLFYFRNESEHECLAGVCGEASVGNAPGEFAYMGGFLPAGRKLQVGVYFGTLFSLSPPEEPSARYDFDLLSLILDSPWLGGATIYASHTLGDGTAAPCGGLDYLDSGKKNCTLMQAYGSKP